MKIHRYKPNNYGLLLWYNILIFFAIKFKKWHIITDDRKGIGKTTLIYKLAKKYNLPVFTNWKELYKECDVYTPIDDLEKLLNLQNQVILVDFIKSQTSLETVYVLSQRGNILIGFDSELNSN